MPDFGFNRHRLSTLRIARQGGVQMTTGMNKRLLPISDPMCTRSDSGVRQGDGTVQRPHADLAHDEE